MASKNSEPSIYLRPDLAYNPKQRNNLTAFSPDLIPLYQTKLPDEKPLTSTYESFIAHDIVPGEYNLVYTRGAAKNPDAKAEASVYISTMTNELIMWPQALREAKEAGRIDLSYDPSLKTNGVVASKKSLKITPPSRGGRHTTVVSAIDADSFLQLPDARNYKELLKIVGSSPSYAFYNAVVADPVFDVYTLTTRLRFFDNSGATVELQLDVEAMGIPAGFDISIYSDHPDINFGRKAIVSGNRVGMKLPINGDFDSLITLQIFNTKGTLPPNYSSVSFVAHVIEGKHGRVEDTVIVGAEHILFDSSIRFRRIALNQTKVDGWYFRNKIGDTDVIPRTGSLYKSPDIQPLGTAPDGNVKTDLSKDTYDTDVSTQRGVNIVAQSPNYVYLRGATNKATHIETSLYAIPNAILISPEHYSEHAIQDVDVSMNYTTAIRELNAPSAGIYTITNPFNWNNPPDPKTLSPPSNHYCLIAEARLYVENPEDKPEWPHQKVLESGADITSWILNHPTVAWRNVSWVENPDAPQDSYQTNMTIPTGYTSTENWILSLQCKDMPLNGYIAMSTTGDVDLNVGKTKILNKDMNVGVNFTGVTGPYSATVTISWWKGEGGARPNGSSLIAVIQHEEVPSSPAAAFAEPADASANLWPFVVGPDYPNLVNNPSIVLPSHVKGPSLLRHAQPILPLQAGRVENRQRSSRIHTLVRLGADTFQVRR